MLDEIERKTIKTLMSDRFTLNQLGILVSDAGASFDGVVRQPANLNDAIMDIVNDAERNDWTVELLRALIDNFRDRPSSPTRDAETARVEAILNNIRERLGRGTALDDPFASCFVRGGLPFVNRPPVRSAFKNLARPEGFPILVLNGPAGSGKTYSKELPSFVSAIQGHKAFKVFYRDLSESPHLWTAEKLVRSILREWALDDAVPSQLAQSSSFASELSEWLTSKTPRDETWWIIIDGLAKITPDPGLLDFLNALASLIANSPRALRLVLLDLGDQNPLPPSAEMMTARVKIGEWTTADLVDHYFKTLHVAQATDNPFDAALLTAKAQSILEQVKNAGEGKPFTKLKEALLQATQELGFG